jgi:D-alanyl-D-alanine carboxypeptidase/D-alanyl-D-alanine-endopeptidase (penicillin-binding protein 4)
LLSLLLLAPPALAGAPEVRARLGQLVATLPRNTQVGLLVRDSVSGEAWYEHNADLPLKPASVQKLFVTAVALERWGPDFTFDTPLLVVGDELWVIGGGDPGLGDDRIAERYGREPLVVFDEWAGALKAAGLSTISRVVLDDTLFDQQARHPDWDPDQFLRWYEAPVGALNVCTNCVTVRVLTNAKTAVLNSLPPLPPELLQNTVIRGRRHRVVLNRQAGEDAFQVSGTATRSAEVGTATANRPTPYFAQVLKRALADRGVTINGPIVRRVITADEQARARRVAVHRTALRDIIWRCNSHSQNLFAECLLKSLVARDAQGRPTGTPGSWAAGIPSLLDGLRRLGVDVRGLTLRDASGLSHNNRATARHFVTLLHTLRASRHAQVFAQSMAEPGEEGTLRDYTAPTLRGRMRAKTGTILGVQALAGYVTRRDGHVLDFALLVNGTAPNAFRQDIAAALMR